MPAALRGEIAPLSCGMVTVTSVSAKLSVTVAVSTHTLPLPDTAVVMLTSVLDDVKPKSAAVTPVTAWLNVAVIGMTLLAVVAALAPSLDEKVGAGPCGTVVYWSVPDLDAALSWLQDHGATLYRGPITIEGGQRMCQVQDPWGNCIGLRSKPVAG